MSAEHLGPGLVHAYVFIRVEGDQAGAIAARIRERVPDAEVHVVSGVYDIVLEIESEGQEYVSAMTRDHVRATPGVTAFEILWAVD